MSVLSRKVHALLFVVMLTGCANATTNRDLDGGSPSGSAPSESSRPVTPEVACPVQEPRHLSEGHPRNTDTDAYICTQENQSVPGDGIWLVHVVRRVTSGLDALLEAYRLPDDEAPDSGIACPANLPNPLVVYLHGDSGTRAIRAPVDMCGAPSERAQSAYRSLITTVVGEQRDRRTQSQLSVDSNCPDDFKDTLSLDEQYPPDGVSDSAAPSPLSAPVSVCMYRISIDGQGDRIGHLEAHRTLTADQAHAVNTALRLVRGDSSCSRHEQTRFAVLNMAQRDETVVALDGCAVSQGSDWWRADDQLRLAVGV